MSISCQQCKALMKISNAPPGAKAKCPRCGAKFTIPQTSILAGAPQPAAVAPQPLLSEPLPTPERNNFTLPLIIAGCAVLALFAIAGLVGLAFLQDDTLANKNNVAAAKDVDQIVPANLDEPNPTNTNLPEAGAPTAKEPADKTPSNKGRLGAFTVEFMGSMAKGRRFCIIADSSHSMKRGINLGKVKRKKKVKGRITLLDYLKKELLKTVGDLKTGAHYSVILFDAGAIPMPGPDWREGGNMQDYDDLVKWIRSIKTHLYTRPLPAFERAFKLKPRPDVIFFMTDGAFAANAWKHIADLNDGDPKVVINTIQISMEKAPRKKIKKKQNLARALTKVYGKQQLPPEIAQVLREMKKDMSKGRDPRQVYQEAQMRIIAAMSGGAFRHLELSP